MLYYNTTFRNPCLRIFLGDLPVKQFWPLLLLPLSSVPVLAAQKHIHDQGELFIAQDGNQWHFEFVLPAINAFGFEHLPENDAQQHAIHQFVKQIASTELVLKLNKQCSLDSASESISDVFLNGEHLERDHEHDIDDNHKHQDEHEASDNHEHHDEHETAEAQHFDAEFSYVFTCKASVNTIEIVLFDRVENLEQLSVQWVVEAGQGAQELTSANRTLKFNSGY